jgi:hypothetical protein
VTLTIETTRRSLYLSGPLGTLWGRLFSPDEGHDFPHPEGRSWGVTRAGGEVSLYMGRLFVTLAGRGAA